MKNLLPGAIVTRTRTINKHGNKHGVDIHGEPYQVTPLRTTAGVLLIVLLIHCHTAN